MDGTVHVHVPVTVVGITLPAAHRSSDVCMPFTLSDGTQHCCAHAGCASLRCSRSSLPSLW